MSASSMALQLHFAPAYEKSNSTTANSGLGSNRGARLVGGGIFAVGRRECRRCARSATKSTTEKPANLAGQEIETVGADLVRLRNFGSQRTSRSARLLGRSGRERK